MADIVPTSIRSMYSTVPSESHPSPSSARLVSTYRVRRSVTVSRPGAKESDTAVPVCSRTKPRRAKSCRSGPRVSDTFDPVALSATDVMTHSTTPRSGTIARMIRPSAMPAARATSAGRRMVPESVPLIVSVICADVTAGNAAIGWAST